MAPTVQNFSIRVRDGGFTLIEVLFAIGICAIIMMGVVKSSGLASSTINRSINNSLATRIAQDTLENYYLADPESLTEKDSFNDTVKVEHYEFARKVEIEVNADRSRTLRVAVEGSKEKSGGKAIFVTSIALRGTR